MEAIDTKPLRAKDINYCFSITQPIDKKGNNKKKVQVEEIFIWKKGGKRAKFCYSMNISIKPLIA